MPAAPVRYVVPIALAAAAGLFACILFLMLLLPSLMHALLQVSRHRLLTAI
jgi:hypothetical protein